MKKYVYLICVALCGLASCKDKQPVTNRVSTGGIKIDYPADVQFVSVSAESLAFTNRTTGQLTEAALGATVELFDGLYDCAYEAQVVYDNNGTSVSGHLYGAASGVEIHAGQADFTITAYLFAAQDDFIIEEIFFTGTLYPTGAQYHGDCFVKLYNNTDHVLYADGLAFVETKFLSVQKWDYQPDIRNDTATVQAIYVIPGTGKEHPVQPGGSLLLCDIGIDHRISNANSFDLSAADFEWYDESTVPSVMDIDSETVPNLDKWYCYTQSIWVLHNRGFRSYAIARMPVDKETYLRDYLYTYSYVMHLEAGDFPMTQTAYKLPNAWIVDGVNCSVEAERLWNVLPPAIDAGWTSCGTINSDPTRYFKSVRRKMLYLTEDGRRVLQDTNNSSKDFNASCVPSLVEEQQTAISADGTPATGRTYDGVQPMP